MDDITVDIGQKNNLNFVTFERALQADHISSFQSLLMSDLESCFVVNFCVLFCSRKKSCLSPAPRSAAAAGDAAPHVGLSGGTAAPQLPNISQKDVSQD
ncbi:hypothetical protein AV530_001136 [Patagioenas fasciata monilis]|uniref:Uncharacterized protein n=1 Tax=Patagioenas fasciata monilis TaxID=372326 RepID=A0A1V4KTM5_PATFA|nr:hypothetical protein AV530_001136 [Patagioenas fasciata monilis]